MNRKLEKIRQRKLNDAEARHEQRCRALIIAIRDLPKPLSYKTVCDNQLCEPSGKWFSGALHIVEAEATLQAALNACIELGWLQVTHRQQPHAITPADKFKVMPTAYRVKAKTAKKQPTVSRPVTITVNAEGENLKVRFNEKSITLKGDGKIVLAALYYNRNKTLSLADFGKSTIGALRKSVKDLRDRLGDLGLEKCTLKNGIVTDHGQGYRLDTSILKIVWKDELGRQRGVVNNNQL